VHAIASRGLRGAWITGDTVRSHRGALCAGTTAYGATRPGNGAYAPGCYVRSHPIPGRGTTRCSARASAGQASVYEHGCSSAHPISFAWHWRARGGACPTSLPGPRRWPGRPCAEDRARKKLGAIPQSVLGVASRWQALYDGASNSTWGCGPGCCGTQGHLPGKQQRATTVSVARAPMGSAQSHFQERRQQ